MVAISLKDNTLKHSRMYKLNEMKEHAVYYSPYDLLAIIYSGLNYLATMITLKKYPLINTILTYYTYFLNFRNAISITFLHLFRDKKVPIVLF